MSDYTGLYRGSVQDINDPESRGRLRLLIPAALGDAVSGWAEPSLPTVVTPVWNVGDRVWAQFEDGDINRPVYTARMEVTQQDLSQPVTDSIQAALDAANTDGLAPVSGTTLTGLGGIGSLFFRWTEVANADPVLYRLHVRAGAAPTTDGTYEVAAGVGMTSASVRRLKGATDPVVPDGTVVYYGIVTVEDGDVATAGRGPDSNTVMVSPAQVTTADIAVNALTADLLNANDAFIGALNTTVVKAKSVQIGESLTTDVPRWDSTGFFIPGVATFPSSGLGVQATIPNLGVTTLTSEKTSMRGTANEVTQGGRVTLQTGTQSPTSPPSYTEDWATFTPSATITSGSVKSVASDGTNLYWLLSTYHVWRTDMAGASPVDLGSCDVGSGNKWFGAVKVGTYLYGTTFNGATNSYSITRLTIVGSAIDGTTLTTIATPASTGVSINNVKIGVLEGDTTKLLTMFKTSGNVIAFDTVTISTGAATRVTTSVSETATGGSQSSIWGCTAAVAATYGFSGARTVFTRAASGVTTPYVYAAPTRQTAEEWPLNVDSVYGGSSLILTDGTNLLSYNSHLALVTRYTNEVLSGGAWRTISATWYQTGGINPETMEGPRYSYQPKLRKRTSLSYPASVPSGLTGMRIYMGQGATQANVLALANTGMWRQVDTTTPTIATYVSVPPASTGNHAPAGTGFTASTPARVQSADSTYYVDGLGDANLRDVNVRSIQDGTLGTGTFRDFLDARTTTLINARTQAGTYTSGTVTTAAYNAFTITFPTEFASAPVVVATWAPSGAPGSTLEVRVAVGSVTTTGFTIYLYRGTGTGGITANWIAYVP